MRERKTLDEVWNNEVHWSHKRTNGMIEFKYIRKSFLYKRDFPEVVWCSNEVWFYRYLDHMNCTHRHNKFFSEYKGDFYASINDQLVSNYERAKEAMRGKAVDELVEEEEDS